MKDFIISKEEGIFPTFFIFMDLPKHLEYRVQNMPLLKEGMIVDFNLNINDLRSFRHPKIIKGNHIINKCVFKYGGKRPGLVQYVEWKAI